MAVADGGEGTGQDDAFDFRVAGGAEEAEGAFAGWDDEFVFVFRDFQGKGRGDVEDVVATGGGFGPALVGQEVGGGEGQAAGRVRASGFEHGADLWFTIERTDGRADAVASVQELEDAVGCDESGASGD